MDTTTTPATSFKDWRYYSFWWWVWIVVPGMLQALGGGQTTTAKPGGMLLALLLFTAYALLASTVFTIVQNRVNPQRRKAVSWALAIGIWFVLVLGSVALFSR